MTTTWMAGVDSEAGYDSEGGYDSEAGYEGEASYDAEAPYDSEDYRSAAAARQARARRIALARQRMNQARLRPTVPAPGPARPPTTAQTVSAIRSLDLETKVSTDSLRAALERANRRATRATYATVASVTVDQAFDSFAEDFEDHDFIRAGLRYAPLLALSPERRRPGVEGVVLDPRFIGGVAVAGVVIAGQLRNRGLGVDTIAINTPTLTAASAAGRLLGIATTRTGRDVSDQIVWRSKDNAVLQVQPDGSFVVGKAGLAPVTATVGGRTETVFIDVKP